MDVHSPTPGPDSLPAWRRRLLLVGVFVCYLIVAVLFFHATWADPSHVVMGPTTFAQGQVLPTSQLADDPLVSMWFLAWPAHAIGQGHPLLATDYIAYPTGANLMWNGLVLPLGLIASPIVGLFGIVVTYNILMTLALAVGAYLAFLAIRRWVPGTVAPGVGGARYSLSQLMRSSCGNGSQSSGWACASHC